MVTTYGLVTLLYSLRILPVPLLAKVCPSMARDHAMSTRALTSSFGSLFSDNPAKAILTGMSN